jgi:hypothetical protein
MAVQKIRRYHSRRDASIGVLVLSVSAVCAASTGVAAAYGRVEVLLASSAASAAVIGILLWMWAGTYYVLTEECLLIQSGPFSLAFPLESILSVRRIRSLHPAPALSQDRLALRFRAEGSVRMVHISPFDESGFLEELHRLDPLLPLP